MAEQHLDVVIVGAGNMAREHARAFAAVPGVRVAGIHSRTRARAELLARELGIPLVAGSLAELHERTRAALAVVTVFETSMKAVALDALDHPWTLLLEKPPGLVPEETEAIAAKARERRRDVRVGLNRQWIGATQAVLAALGEHDGPRFVKVQDQQTLAQARAIGHPPEVVRNWMFANSIHLVDYFRYLARGEARRVEAIQPWRGEETQVLLARIEFTSGDVGLYEAIWHAPGPWAATVTVPGRRWELRPLEQLTTQALGERPQAVPPHAWDAEFKPGFRLQAQHAVDAARGAGSPLPTIDDALRTMRLVRALYPA
jgi:predicted dehydrogenase